MPDIDNLTRRVHILSDLSATIARTLESEGTDQLDRAALAKLDNELDPILARLKRSAEALEQDRVDKLCECGQHDHCDRVVKLDDKRLDFLDNPRRKKMPEQQPGQVSIKDYLQKAIATLQEALDGATDEFDDADDQDIDGDDLVNLASPSEKMASQFREFKQKMVKKMTEKAAKRRAEKFAEARRRYA